MRLIELFLIKKKHNIEDGQRRTLTKWYTNFHSASK